MGVKFFKNSTMMLPFYLFGIYEIINSNYLLGIAIIATSSFISWILSIQKLKE